MVLRTVSCRSQRGRPHQRMEACAASGWTSYRSAWTRDDERRSAAHGTAPRPGV